MTNKRFFILLAIIGIAYLGKYIYQLPKYNGGEKAPQIEAVLINGQQFELSQLEGNYVLLDFWGSWCGPCRAENPQLVNLYSKYGGKGFEIVSVGVERKESRWRSAIAMDNLGWKYHIGQFDRFKSPIVSAYGVKNIPTKYLINPKGEIIGVNQSIEEIDAFLKSRL